jgi:acetoacetyl-CoA synthetase
LPRTARLWHRLRVEARGQGVQVREGDLLWTPGPDRVERANVTAFARWLGRERGHGFDGYQELWQWSVTDLDGFWQAVWDYCGVQASTPPTAVLGARSMPGADWFPGARLNYAQHVLRHERPGQDALYHQSETTPLAGLPWPELANSVRVLATQLRALGIRPGDRVASCMPNIPQTAIAMLATTSIGAIWTSCSPDFGGRGISDRFGQLSPRVLFCVDSYRYGGRDYDRSAEMQQVIAGLPSLGQVIWVPGPLGTPIAAVPDGPRIRTWAELMDHPPVPAAGFGFEQVPFSHPLWILFSSGTTGLPKAITHSHGGILIEQLKLQTLNMDLRPGDRMFFYTTAGWMMWNFLVSSLLLGVRPLLYDGHPGYPRPDVLWEMAEAAGVTFFGASPAYVDLLARAGLVPGEKYDLSALTGLMLAGSPVSAECGAWFYRNVKRDLWLHVGSGGTDVCTGFTGGAPTLPVYAGEHQARNLGVAAYAFNAHGEAVTGEVGEMVITQPMPSMPVRMWNDDDGRLYRQTYFADFPGVWRQGDFFKVNERGGCFVLGRSDATLNRHGIRIGTAEVYAALESVTQLSGSLIVNLDLPGGRFFMPLFVTLDDGAVLNDALRRAITDRLRSQYTARHVPDRIIQVPAIPVTLTGKKMEVPVRKILLGVPPDEAANRNAMANPASLDAFAEYARTQQDYRVGDERESLDDAGQPDRLRQFLAAAP